MKILAIESSCDETAAAVVEDGRTVLGASVATQIEIHRLYGGVVPEIASRKHIEAISYVVDEAVQKSGLRLTEIDAVAATYAPGLIGAVLVGLNFAKGLSYSMGVPLIPVHHIRGHIASNYIAFPALKPPFMVLIASGGHSHIVKVLDYCSFQVLGRTRDDAAGEAFDKVARVLGLPYPGGLPIDTLAKEGDPNAVHFPRVHFPDAPYDFSFSGVKTAVLNTVNQLKMQNIPIPAADIAASFNEAAADILSEKLIAAARDHGMKTVAACGGVAANSRLRGLLAERAAREGMTLFVPPLSLCGDNAQMIGAQGYYEFQAGRVAPLSQNAYSTIEIDA